MSSLEPSSSALKKQLAAAAAATGSAEEEDDSLGGSCSEDTDMDPKLHKKQQNSVRWKRWWLKNREAYNEKRRLSAQLRSAKLRAEKGEISAPATKRIRKTVPTAEPAVLSRRSSNETDQLQYALADGRLPPVPPSISPAHTFKAMVPPGTATAGLLPSLSMHGLMPNYAQSAQPFMFPSSILQPINVNPMFMKPMSESMAQGGNHLVPSFATTQFPMAFQDGMQTVHAANLLTPLAMQNQMRFPQRQ